MASNLVPLVHDNFLCLVASFIYDQVEVLTILRNELCHDNFCHESL
jgi:hypothetical protein